MGNRFSKRRTFERKTAIRSYRIWFIIAVEGAKTEPIYFSLFNDENTNIRFIKCLEGQDANSPPQVLERLVKFLRENSLMPIDQAWCVVDKDLWTEKQLKEVYDWSLSNPQYGLAVSNPKFEFWLLLHFEDAAHITSSRSCSDRLKRHLPDYDKKFDARKISQSMIYAAISRAKKRDNPGCIDWPRSPGCTTVYKLVERIMDMHKNA